MGRFSASELDAAFRRYWQTGAVGENWDAWADLFTEDATYVEHHYGTFGGREAIRRWITGTMATFPGSAMPHFPVEWYVVDEERGWVIAQVWNRMADPGDGSVHQAANITILHYAGHGRWSYEEDVYNPAHFATMLGGWESARRRVAGQDGAGGDA